MRRSDRSQTLAVQMRAARCGRESGLLVAAGKPPNRVECQLKPDSGHTRRPRVEDACRYASSVARAGVVAVALRAHSRLETSSPSSQASQRPSKSSASPHACGCPKSCRGWLGGFFCIR